jgi:Tol biopolymer transport system component
MKLEMIRRSAMLSRRQFVGLAAGMAGFGVPAAAFAEAPRLDRRIAFVSGNIANGYGKIWIMRPDGSDRRALTKNVGEPKENDPAWSPDGRRIAFCAFRHGKTRIYVRDSDGENEICLTPDPTLGDYYEHPAWSPDTTKIAFTVYHPDHRTAAHVCVMSADGTDQRQLTFGNHYDWCLCFSSDGRRIIFGSTRDGNRKTYAINLDGSNPTNLSTNPEGDDGFLAYSPDGTRVAFSTHREVQKAAICVMNLDGSNLVSLTHDAGGDSSPEWSPDSGWIAFVRSERGSDSNPMDIYIMKADGSNRVNLTHSKMGIYNWSPRWEP